MEQVSEVKEPQDMTAEEMAQRERDFSREAFAVLNERREKGYAAARWPLDKELTALAGESAEIETRSQGFIERMASAERVKRFEADQLLIQGKDGEAQAKLAELEEAKAAPAKIEERRREIEERVGQIEAAKRTALRRAAEDFKWASITLIRANETALATTLDGVRDALNTLEAQLGVSLYQPAELTAPEKSAEWFTLNRLYCPRVR
jgi:ribosomal protein L34